MFFTLDLDKFHVRKQEGCQPAAVHRPGVYADFVAFHQGFWKDSVPENYWFAKVKRRTDKPIPDPEAPVRGLFAQMYTRLQAGMDINTVSVFMGEDQRFKKISVIGRQAME